MPPKLKDIALEIIEEENHKRPFQITFVKIRKTELETWVGGKMLSLDYKEDHKVLEELEA